MTIDEKRSIRLVFIVHLWSTATCLPTLRLAAPTEPKLADPLQSILISSAACLFLGGQACQNNQIPVGPGHQLDGKAKLGSAQGLVLPILKPILGADNLDSYRGTDVNIGQPRLSSGNGLDILGLYKTQQGVRDAGLRGQGNYGAAWGGYSSILGNLIGYGDVNDVNFNADRLSVNHERRNGVQGLYEETFRTVVDPLSLKFGRVKETCYARLLFGGKGLCSLQDVGLAPPPLA